MADLVKTLVDTVGDQVATAIAMAVVGALVQLMRKWHLDISAAKRERLEAAAKSAVRRAEEEAATMVQRAVRNNVPAIGVSGPEKFATAVAYTRAAVPSAKQDDVVNEVTAALPATGFGAAAKQQAAAPVDPRL